jgi:malonyl-CoA O-methyltransferase
MSAKPIAPAQLLSATAYDQAAVLQREVATRMAERLSYLKLAPQRIIDIGARTGFGTRLVQQHFPQASVMALDSEAHILAQGFPAGASWKRLLGLGGNEFICSCADFAQLPLRNASVDMLWSNLALHYHDPDAMFKEAQRVLKPGGLLMFSLFGPDTLKELRTASSGASMKRLIDMHDVGDVLSHNGFTAPVMDMETITLTYSALPDLLQDLHHTGEAFLLPEILRDEANQTARSTVAQQYEAFRAEGKLPATYEIVYGHAWNNEGKKLSQDGRQIIEFRRYPSSKM